MMFSLEILPEAEADIVAAAQDYEEREMGLAARFTTEVSRAIRSLVQNALLYQVRHQARRIRWVIPQPFPYRIAYRIKGGTAQVFAVIHCARHDRELWRRAD